MTLSQELSKYRIENIPSTAFLIPDFISQQDEEYLLRKIDEQSKYNWTNLSNRRLQNWGGHPTEKGMIPTDLPDFVKRFVKHIDALNLFPKTPNHILVNEYLPGQGIMPHFDGPIYYPLISTLSLGSHTILDFYDPASNAENGTAIKLQTSVFVPQRSLLLLKDAMYSDLMHGIKQVSDDVINPKDIANRNHLPECDTNLEDMPYKLTLQREKRISLTIRLVEKVAKFKLFSK